MSLVHTLLFMLRTPRDLLLAVGCLKSLEKSAFRTVVLYNQGSWTNEQLRTFLAPFALEFHILGDGVNVGTAEGRQKCFEYIWAHLPKTTYISELHLDMIFPPLWEEPLTQYLEQHDEPLIGSGIVDKTGKMPFLGKTVALPEPILMHADFLSGLRTDCVVPGFTNPCVHVSEILQKTGGYQTDFLKGRHCFEDDSMLLGYYYYYGTARAWQPKVNFNTVVYHEVAGQRMGIKGGTGDNYSGLIKQYGMMGLKALSELHTDAWHKRFFAQKYRLGAAPKP